MRFRVPMSRNVPGKPMSLPAADLADSRNLPGLFGFVGGFHENMTGRFSLAKLRSEALLVGALLAVACLLLGASRLDAATWIADELLVGAVLTFAIAVLVVLRALLSGLGAPRR